MAQKKMIPVIVDVPSGMRKDMKKIMPRLLEEVGG